MKLFNLSFLGIAALLAWPKAAEASMVDCVDSLKKRSISVTFSSPRVADFLDLYDPLEKQIYLYPKVPGQPDYSFFLITEDNIYLVDHKPGKQSRSGLFTDTEKQRPKYFVAKDNIGKTIGFFESEIEGPIEKTFSLKPLPIEDIGSYHKGTVETVKAQVLRNPEDLKAVKESFVIDYWKVWKESKNKKRGLSSLFSSDSDDGDDGWNDVQEACAPYFENIESVELDLTCNTAEVCGSILEKKEGPTPKAEELNSSEDESEDE